ncbi:unnamed protein product, partial [Pleuronectes platessa]
VGVLRNGVWSGTRRREPPRALETQDVCVRVDRPGPVMEPELNCSSHCDSPLCFIHAGVNRQEGLDILQRLCSLSTTKLHKIQLF